MGTVGLGVSSFSGRATAATPWTIAVLPDTQKYAESSSLISRAAAQTNWIKNNKSAENIVFVSHAGDLVENGSSTTEWRRIDGVMDTLDGVVPYATTVGNHDYATTSDRSSSTANYSTYFGRNRYSGRSWFRGTGPNDRAHYQRFSAGGYDFLHLDLEWGVPGTVSNANTVMGWANGILSQNPNTPTIVTTHAYLWDRVGYEGHATDRKGANSGRDIYRNLIRRHPQVFMMLNGHYHRADGQWNQTSTNDAGSRIYEMLSNYQDYANGGDGWMRLVKFVPDGGSSGLDRISVRTYSPSRNEYKTDRRSQFSFDLDFASRFSSTSTPPTPPAGASASFQQGANGYSSTRDTYLQEAAQNADNGSETTLVVDRDDPVDSGFDAQGLVRFGDIVGTGTGQVPPRATVTSAQLELSTVDRGSGASLHRMKTDWAESDTWASLLNGVQTDGVEANSSADVKTGSTSVGTTTVDVTSSVNAWVNGAANLGWVFVPSGRNGWDFASSEGTPAPKLVVSYETA
ncbi:DNRLRE domain-containing protein [Halorubrum sp. HHNYT27]|uniref:DNRLRE domain-containing protein n=1 Tax=Halorubrum sp. HHNYT27 TaxID=3402275 RepID=UPI003EB87ABD